jgi:hypothetical protein
LEKRKRETTERTTLAKALELNYASISVEAQTGKHVFGFIDANGNFVETEFYKIFKTAVYFNR